MAAGLWFPAGCADTAPEPAGLRLVTAAAGPCVENGNDNAQFPGLTAVKLVVRITGPDSETVKSFTQEEATEAHVIVTGVTPGTGLEVQVVACDANDQPVWAGQTGGVTVEASHKTFPEVFLTPIGQVACIAKPDLREAFEIQAEAHAYSATARIGDAVWVLGGLGSYSSKVATATRQIIRYNRLTGVPRVVDAQLSEARAMALAQPMSDGRIRLVGGSSRLEIGQINKPPLFTPAPAAPSCAVEIIDPETGASSCEYEGLAIPSGSAVAATGQGRFVLAGGDVAPGAPSDGVWILDNGTVTTGTMSVGRYGASVVPLPGDGALIWGGVLNGDSGVVGDHVSADGTVWPLTTNYSGSTTPLLTSAAYLGKTTDGRHAVLIVGGTEATATSLPSKAISRLDLLRIDTDAKVVEVTPVPMDTDFKLFARAAGALVELDSGELWLSGGYHSFSAAEDVCPGQSGQCFPSRMVRFTVDAETASLAVLDDQLAISVGVMGATPQALGDDSYLVMGGFLSLGADALPGAEDCRPTKDDQNPPCAVGGELVRYSTPLDGLCVSDAP